MSELPSHLLKKGTRVLARQLGKADVVGKVTWVGPSRYGAGFRYGIKGDDGGTYWVDDEGVTPESGAVVDPEAIQKGSRVRVVSGKNEGLEGDVYIAGAAGRFGVRDDDEETYWFNLPELERI